LTFLDVYEVYTRMREKLSNKDFVRGRELAPKGTTFSIREMVSVIISLRFAVQCTVFKTFDIECVPLIPMGGKFLNFGGTAPTNRTTQEGNFCQCTASRGTVPDGIKKSAYNRPGDAAMVGQKRHSVLDLLVLPRAFIIIYHPV
jgi:hypothetical protein